MSSCIRWAAEVAALVLLGMPAAGATTAQSPLALPDFSGVWHRWFRPGLGPSASGPGPLVDRSLFNGVADYNQLVGDYTNPILKPEAADVVKHLGDLSLEGVGYPTPSNQCWPSGVPYVFWNFGLQIIQQTDKVTMLYLHDHEVRRVRLNQSHPAHVTPSWYGDSVGRYEGGTLLIDTVGVKRGPYPMLDMYGTPFSDALHVVERYRLVDYGTAKPAIEREAKINTTYPRGLNAIEYDPNYRGKHLELVITVDDPKEFTTPWTSTMIYGRPTGSWVEHVCAENTQEYYNNKDSDVPKADKPDF